MTDNPDRIERTLELLLYAPIGVGLFLKDSAPTFVDMFVARGRAEIDRRQGDVQQRVTTARSLGQVAMAFGPPIVRQKVEQTVTDARRRAEGLFGSSESDVGIDVGIDGDIDGEPATAPDPPASTPAAATPTPTPESGWSAYAPLATPADVAGTVAPTRTNGDAADSDGASSAELPIPGYDALSASQVVERLIGLAPDELQAVHAYESSHRQRRTILGQIDQLAG